MNRMTLSLVTICLCFVSSSGIAATSYSQSRSGDKPITVKSNTWEVTLSSAAVVQPGTIGKPGVQPGKRMLEVGLKFRYLGTDGEVEAPALFAVGADGIPYRMLGNLGASESFDGMEWALSGSHEKSQKTALKQGQTFGKFLYYVEVPESDPLEKVRFRFGDTESFALPIKVR
jgi:hypothetical protein